MIDDILGMNIHVGQPARRVFTSEHAASDKNVLEQA
jgi:hypothetical protein